MFTIFNTYQLKIYYDVKTRQVEIMGLYKSKILDYELMFGCSTILDIFIYLYNNNITNITLDTFKKEYTLYFYKEDSYLNFKKNMMNYLIYKGNNVV
jgi:hypothetical protein